MKQPDRKAQSAALDRAEELLLEMRTLRAEITVLESNAERKINEIRSRYQAEIVPRGERFADLGKELLGLMRGNKEDIFAGTDKVELIHGILFCSLGIKVVIPRGALAKIEAEGWDEAIRVAKSIDRATVESWPPWKLEKIGASRKEVENFFYEIRMDDNLADSS